MAYLNQQLRKAQRAHCYLCGQMMAPEGGYAHSSQCQSIDHIQPRSKGGEKFLPNIAAAHSGCNNAKSDRDPYPCEVLFGEIVAEMVHHMIPALRSPWNAKRLARWLQGVPPYETALAAALRQAGLVR